MLPFLRHILIGEHPELVSADFASLDLLNFALIISKNTIFNDKI